MDRFNHSATLLSSIDPDADEPTPILRSSEAPLIVVTPHLTTSPSTTTPTAAATAATITTTPTATSTPVATMTNNSTYPSSMPCPPGPIVKSYDYTLKFLLVGDSDVGKEEILDGLDEEESNVTNEEGYYTSPAAVTYRSTVILLEGKRIRLLVWDTSGQGRFSTIIRSYSRGAQGILLVYDITNKWSFSGLDRWLREVETHAPGVPKILLGNRLHLAFNRQVSEKTAESYAHKHNMSFFEVSPLCNFNVRESFTELSRVVLQRHGMESLWRHSNVLSLQELCCRAIVAQTTSYGVEQLTLPGPLKTFLKSYAGTATSMTSSKLVKPCFKIYQQSPSEKDKDTLKRKAQHKKQTKKTLFPPHEASSNPSSPASQSASSPSTSNSNGRSNSTRRTSSTPKKGHCTIS